jgi:4-amino-4-deoxy-L-arabinose transferase-like glycosyltransferase
MAQDSHNPNNCPAWALIAVGLFAILLRAAGYDGLAVSDDMGYAHFADRIATGQFRLEHHHYAIRFGMTVPVALLYFLFGMQEWTTALYPFVASVAASVLLAAIGCRIGGAMAGLFSGLLLASLPMEALYGGMLVPEAVLQAALLAAALLYVVADERSSPRLAGLSGVAFGLAFLVKEPAVFVLAAFVLFGLLQRRYRLALALAAGAASVAGAEFALFYWATGDPFFIHSAMKVHNAGMMRWAETMDLPYRLFKYYPRILLIPGAFVGLHGLVATVAALYGLLRWKKPACTLLLLWAVIPYLYLNFGSSSFREYMPLPAAHRYLLVTFPPLLLLAGLGLAGVAARGRKWLPGVGLVVALAGAAGLWGVLHMKADHEGRRTTAALKAFVQEARTGGQSLCLAPGTSYYWEMAVRVWSPGLLGCEGDRVLHLTEDRQLMPVRGRTPVKRVLQPVTAR